MESVPLVDFDPFSDAVVDDPFGRYEALREGGPVFRTILDGQEVYGIPRYREVAMGLTDHERFSSAGGLGLHPLDRYQAGVLVASDPPDHTRLRQVVGVHMGPRAMARLEQGVRELAARLVDEVIERENFDVIADLAEPFTRTVVADLVGLPARDRELFPAWAAAGFGKSGPLTTRDPAFDDLLRRMMDYIGSLADGKELAPDSIGDQVFQAVDRGVISAEEATSMVFGGFVLAGLHTSIRFFGNTLAQFAEFPDQWDVLRADPAGRVAGAIEESVRRQSPLQSFFRTARHGAAVDDVPIPDGSRVMMMYGSANRDPRHWQGADTFDITRTSGNHLGFGTGTHSCLGAPLLRLEATSLLRAFAERGVTGFELAGEPERGDSVAYGWSSLPMTTTRKP